MDEKNFLHIGSMGMGKNNKWKILKNEDVDIENFANAVAVRASEMAGDTIGFFCFEKTRKEIIKTAVKLIITQAIDDVVRKDND